MSETYRVENLPEVDQRAIKRGLCPWCLARLVDNGVVDECADCGDVFEGKITVED